MKSSSGAVLIVPVLMLTACVSALVNVMSEKSVATETFELVKYV
ncbi:putative lipoprotein [Ruegeria lacuscaerulensis ITI-1157]|nr:putative lipoprotein [Ruegeria lacuscaerulensis ITI-1157]